MRALLVTLALSGCTGLGSSLSAEAELLLSATNGAEEGLASRAVEGGLGPAEDPDQPPLFRECSGEQTWEDIFARYDADGDHALGEEEAAEVEAGRGGRDDFERHMAERRWHLMLVIYDLDGDHDLSEPEQSTLLEDFGARCELLHEQLVATYDADGDGALSDEELATAEEALRAEEEARRAEMEARFAEEHPDGPPPGPPPEVPPELAGFDTDGDEAFSEEELVVLRETLRARVRAGEPIVEPPPEE